MGCFNVACSVSNISIGAGTKVAFIPLIPTYMDSTNGAVVLSPNSMLTYPTAIFEPATMPIFGEYDDYGGVENVERNQVVEDIEAYFELKIDTILSMITENRSVWSSFGTQPKEAIVDQELFNQHAYEEIDANFLWKLGFRQDQKTKRWVHELTNKRTPTNRYAVLTARFNELTGEVETDKNRFDCTLDFEEHSHYGLTPKIKVYNNGTFLFETSGRSERDNFAEAWFRHTGYMLNIKPEYQEKIRYIKSMSGMFVHRTVYDRLASKPINFYGETSLERLHQSIIKGAEELKKLEESLGDVDVDLSVFKRNSEGYRFFFRGDHGSDEINSDIHCVSFMKDTGGLKELMFAFAKFKDSMFLTNRFFFPAMNGAQHGDTNASLLLAGVTNEILLERKAEEEEDGY